MALANMTQEQTNEYNRQHCKRIAEAVEAYADGQMYKCPECGEEFEMPEGVGDKFKCTHCGEVFDIDDAEQLSLYDYFDDILDIEYLVNARKEYKAVKICVAWGGPSIYIDTEIKAVCLYWWGQTARYYMSYDAVAAVDEWAEEYFNCL